MTKKEKVSIIISFVFTFLCFCALVFMAYWLPDVVNSMLDTADHIGNRAKITASGRTLVLVDAYCILGVAFVAVVLIAFLLREVYRGEVFSKAVTGLLTSLVFACVAEAILFALLTPCFQIALCVAIAACLLALLLRVVTHVIEEAMRIKSENDFTI
jgi:hypothetical protein